MNEPETEETSQPKQIASVVNLETIVNIDEEIKEFEKRLEQRPTDDTIPAKLSDLYIERNDPRKNVDLEKAKEYALKALKQNPQNIAALTNLGYLAYLHDYEWFGSAYTSPRAKYYLRRAIKVAETKEIGDRECIRIADLAHCVEEKETVDEYVKSSLQKNPRNVDAILYKIRTEEDQRKKEQIIRGALRYEPHHLGAIDGLANLLFDKGDRNGYDMMNKRGREIANKKGLTDLLWIFE